jgi:Fe-S-cluster containining protein
MNPADLKMALDIADPSFVELEAYYRLLPDTACDCKTPGKCCTFSPEITFTEALQWLHLIQRLPLQQQADRIRRFLEYYFSSPVRHKGCSFLEAGRCGVYPHRPFACRAYGLWSLETGRTRTRRNRQSRTELICQWKRFGVDLPAETVQFEMNYCSEVRCCASAAPGDEKLMEVLSKIYELDRRFDPLSLDFENRYHSDFSFLLASMLLGDRKAVLGKFAVVKDILREQPRGRLESLLDQVRPELVFSAPPSWL